MLEIASLKTQSWTIMCSHKGAGHDATGHDVDRGRFSLVWISKRIFFRLIRLFRKSTCFRPAISLGIFLISAYLHSLIILYTALETHKIFLRNSFCCDVLSCYLFIPTSNKFPSGNAYRVSMQALNWIVSYLCLSGSVSTSADALKAAYNACGKGKQGICCRDCTSAMF